MRNNPLSRVDPSGFTDTCVFCFDIGGSSTPQWPGYLVPPGVTSLSFRWPSSVPRESGVEPAQLTPQFVEFDEATTRRAAQAGAALGIGPMEGMASRFITLPGWVRWVDAASTVARNVAKRAGAAVVAGAGTVAVGTVAVLFPTKMGDGNLTDEEREAARRANAASGGAASGQSMPGDPCQIDPDICEDPASPAAATAVADVTLPGSRYPNMAVKMTPDQFQANLVENGYKVVRQTIGSNGLVTVLTNGQKTYTIYTATSTNSSAVQVTNAAGEILSKIRLLGW